MSRHLCRAFDTTPRHCCLRFASADIATLSHWLVYSFAAITLRCCLRYATLAAAGYFTPPWLLRYATPAPLRATLSGHDAAMRFSCFAAYAPYASYAAFMPRTMPHALCR